MRFARDAARQRESIVVAGGGDGTVNEVLSGVLESGDGARMAILPLGTANDFATSAGIPLGDPYAALRLAAIGEAAGVDVGTMNGRHFLNVASGGFGTEVTSKTPRALKDAIGGGAYALTAMLNAMTARPYRGSLIANGRTYDGSMLLMAVGNGRQAGGGAHLAPHAVIDDGLLDVMVAPDHGDSARFARLIADLLALRHGESSEFHYLQAAELTIESEEPLQFNLDGEPVGASSFKFGISPGVLQLVLPEGCPLLRRAAASRSPS